MNEHSKSDEKLRFKRKYVSTHVIKQKPLENEHLLVYTCSFNVGNCTHDFWFVPLRFSRLKKCHWFNITLANGNVYHKLKCIWNDGEECSQSIFFGASNFNHICISIEIRKVKVIKKRILFRFGKMTTMKRI